MSQTAWRDLVRVNRWVNETVKPMTDMDHWGVIEKWSLPTDGYGDCEDYVLLKRKMLIDAGWPREALLITVVRDKKGEGHAVLTVKTDKGEFVLDNQNENVLAWTETGYRFVKRQSQSDPNVWVSLGDDRRRSPPPAPATAERTRNYGHATRSHPHPSPSQTGSRAASLPPKAGRNFFGRTNASCEWSGLRRQACAAKRTARVRSQEPDISLCSSAGHRLETSRMAVLGVGYVQTPSGILNRIRRDVPETVLPIRRDRRPRRGTCSSSPIAMKSAIANP